MTREKIRSHPPTAFGKDQSTVPRKSQEIAIGAVSHNKKEAKKEKMKIYFSDEAALPY